MSGRAMGLGAAALLAWTAPATARAQLPGITQIQITIVPAGRGMAYANFFPDGRVEGGHLSGDNPPFAHIASARLDGATRRRIWAAARALGDSLLGTVDSVSAGARATGYTMIQVLLTGAEGRQALFVWPADTEAPDGRLRRLEGLLLAHRTGGW